MAQGNIVGLASAPLRSAALCPHIPKSPEALLAVWYQGGASGHVAESSANVYGFMLSNMFVSLGEGLVTADMGSPQQCWCGMRSAAGSTERGPARAHAAPSAPARNTSVTAFANH